MRIVKNPLFVEMGRNLSMPLWNGATGLDCMYPHYNQDVLSNGNTKLLLLNMKGDIL